MQKGIAVIDMGSNTFQLFIAEYKGSRYKKAFSREEHVKLGSNGFKTGYLSQDAMERAVNTLISFRDDINRYSISETKVIGTSSIRDALNKEFFINLVKEKTGFNIEVITGDREAEYIYRGVLQGVQPEEAFVIVDIGGGSTEIIIANRGQVLWKKSHNIGIRRLDDDFELEDPLSNENLMILTRHFKRVLKDFFRELKRYNPKILIGCSGAFETFRDIIIYKSLDIDRYIPGIKIEIDSFLKLNQLLLNSTMQEREKIPGLQPIRKDTIALASLFTATIMEEHKFKEFYQTDYALKEGVVSF